MKGLNQFTLIKCMLTVAIKHFENDDCDRALDQLKLAIGSPVQIVKIWLMLLQLSSFIHEFIDKRSLLNYFGSC